MRLFENTNIDFLGQRRKFYLASLAIIILGIISLFIKPIPLGIDFVGGTELQLRFQTPVDVSEIRGIMENAGFGAMEIKTMGSESDILLRTPLQGEGQTVSDQIQDAITAGVPGNSFEVLRVDKVGPKIGEELRMNALYAIIFSLIGILIYLSLRFQFVYALGAVMALFHDVLITIAAVAIFNAILPLGLEFDQPMLAAFLTLIGFSVNDTVVIFDRIRENIRLYKNEDIETVMNRSVNATLSRTVITGGSVLLSVLVILIFGGEVLRGFSFTFTVGILTGTYSSIFVASAVVVDWKHKFDKKSGATNKKPSLSRM
jgi:preprotein translocase subunit SecF